MLRILKMVVISIFILNSYAYADEWKEYKQQHFIIYYQNAPMDFIKTVEDAAEQYYADITRNLGFTRYKGWTWDERAKIYIYDDSEHYVSSAKAAKWSHGVASPRDKVIRTFPSAHGFFDSTLPHELGHIIFREFVGFKAKIPTWFEEGVAMYQEKAKRWGAHKIVLEAIKDGSFMTLDQLSLIRLTSRTDTKKVNLFYSESASIVQFMIGELGQYRFVRFCRKIKKGGPFEWAIADVYVRFKKIEKLNKSWVNYLTR